MLPTRDQLQIQEQIQTDSEGMEKEIPYKQKTKESWHSYTYIQQNRLITKTIIRDKISLYNHKGVNPKENITFLNIFHPDWNA